jgi:dihydrofolate reductase
LSVFTQVSVDGYCKAADGDMAWMHQQDDDAEFKEFAASNSAADGMLLFGKTTYQGMAAFWPTPTAAQQMPAVAEHMNRRPKVVFSKTLKDAPWNNTRIARELLPEVRKLKGGPGEDMAILGSGTIVSQLAQAGLIDEYKFLVIPVVLGRGTTAFEGMQKALDLRHTKTRTFRNGKVFVVYEPKT